MMQAQAVGGKEESTSVIRGYAAFFIYIYQRRQKRINDNDAYEIRIKRTILQ